MQWLRSNRPISVWLAAFAMLLISLAPTITLTLQGSSDGGWLEVCTTVGTKGIGLPGDDGGRESPTPPTQGHGFEHCPYCSWHVDALTPPPARGLPVLIAPPSNVPHLFFAVPRTLHAWRAAQPRAPPRLS
jgi:Protein of unknown function (DUF2946)